MNLWKNFSYGKGISEPFLVNAPKGLPAGILKKFMRKGLSSRAAFKAAWKQYRRGKKNPVAELMLINSKKRKVVKMSRKRSTGRKHRLSVSGSRGHLRVARKSRLAPHFASSGLSINPFAGLSANRRRRRSLYRNPARSISVPMLGSMELPQIPELLGGVAGFVAVKSLPTMLFPANWQVGVMRIASQGITTLGVSLLANRFLGRRIGRMALYGGLIAMGSELAGQLMVKVGVPVGLYLQPQDLGYYMQPNER